MSAALQTRSIRAAWLMSAPTQKILKLLNEAQADSARCVGGCVRNTILGRKVDDIDIATKIRPEQAADILTRAGISVHPTGIAHGTITAMCEGAAFEITTLRRDVSTDGRRAAIEYSQDWEEDARRRDFRLNAIYCDAQGALFDPEGGIADALEGRIRFIGDAQERLREDFLRLLRFFRFSAWYGKGPLDTVGLKACALQVEGLKSLSAERIWKELKKLLAAEQPIEALRAMAGIGALDIILPEARPSLERRLDLLQGMTTVDQDHFLAPNDLLRFAALLPDQEAAQGACARLKLSNAEKDRLLAAHGREPRIVSYLSMRELRRALYLIGREALEDRVRLAWAHDPAGKASAQWRALLALAAGWERPRFDLTGEEAQAAGVPFGPKIGEVLREVEAWWIDADFPDDKLALIERLKAVAQALC